MVLEKTLESLLDCKVIQPVHPKGNQSGTFIGRTDTEAETPILRLPDPKNWLTGKDPDAGEDWGQEEKWATEGETVGWHHQLNGHELEQAPGAGEGQRSLACCSPWCCKGPDMAERLSNNSCYHMLTPENLLWQQWWVASVKKGAVHEWETPRIPQYLRTWGGTLFSPSELWGFPSSSFPCSLAVEQWWMQNLSAYFDTPNLTQLTPVI